MNKGRLKYFFVLVGMILFKSASADASDKVNKLWMIDPGVMVQKILVNTGGLKPSYLGPNETYFAK